MKINDAPHLLQDSVDRLCHLFRVYFLHELWQLCLKLSANLVCTFLWLKSIVIPGPVFLRTSTPLALYLRVYPATFSKSFSVALRTGTSEELFSSWHLRPVSFLSLRDNISYGVVTCTFQSKSTIVAISPLHGIFLWDLVSITTCHTIPSWQKPHWNTDPSHQTLSQYTASIPSLWHPLCGGQPRIGGWKRLLHQVQKAWYTRRKKRQALRWSCDTGMRSAQSGDCVLPPAGARRYEANYRGIEGEHWAQCAHVRR